MVSDNKKRDYMSKASGGEVTFRDVIEELGRLLAFWPVLCLSSLLGVAAAFVFNRYTENVYQVTATVAVEETENPLAASIDGMLDLGLGFGGNGIVETRIAVLSLCAQRVRGS